MNKFSAFSFILLLCLSLSFPQSEIQKTLHIGEFLSTQHFSVRLSDISSSEGNPSSLDILDSHQFLITQVSVPSGGTYHYTYQSHTLNIAVYSVNLGPGSKWARIGASETPLITNPSTLSQVQLSIESQSINIGEETKIRVQADDEDGSPSEPVEGTSVEILGVTPSNPGAYSIQAFSYGNGEYVSTFTASQAGNYEIEVRVSKGYTVRTAKGSVSVKPALGYISYAYAKVSRHKALGSSAWETDPDGESSSDIPPLEYCQKWFPESKGVGESGPNYLSGWKYIGNSGNYIGPGIEYACLSYSFDNTTAELEPAYPQSKASELSSVKLSASSTKTNPTEELPIYIYIYDQDGSPSIPEEGTKVELSVYDYPGNINLYNRSFEYESSSEGLSANPAISAPGSNIETTLSYSQYSARYIALFTLDSEGNFIFKTTARKSSRATSAKINIISASDASSQRTPTSTSALQTIPLKAGWNMISSATNVGLQEIANSKFTCTIKSPLWAWNGEEYVKGSRLLSGIGYILNVESDCALEVPGSYKETAFPQIPLQKGWNLIGAPSRQTEYSKISGTCGIFKSVYHYNTLQGKYTAGTSLYPGKSYWVYAEKDCTLKSKAQ